MCDTDLFLVMIDEGAGRHAVVGVYTGTLEHVEAYCQARLRDESGAGASLTVEPIRPLIVTQSEVAHAEALCDAIREAHTRATNALSALQDLRAQRAALR